ncbi:MAG: hypothetical protein KAH22_02395 [Thiotrichaceae bacterium]|nr:hypothetical protein [Thiotrichaceae bacterium]
MQDIPIFILTLHCYLASASIDINDIPVYHSIAKDEETYKTITLNQHMIEHSNQLKLNLKNDWGKPQREKAACEVKIIKSNVNGKNDVLISWEWKEKEHSIGFSKYTKSFNFSGSGIPKKVELKQSTPEIEQAEKLLKKIQIAIEQEDSGKLIDTYFKSALKAKYELRGYTQKQWRDAEVAYWQYIFSNKVSSRILGTTESTTSGHFIHLLSRWRNPVFYIKLKDGELFLDINVIQKENTTSVYSIEYIQKKWWKK